MKNEVLNVEPRFQLCTILGVIRISILRAKAPARTLCAWSRLSAPYSMRSHISIISACNNKIRKLLGEEFALRDGGGGRMNGNFRYNRMRTEKCAVIELNMHGDCRLWTVDAELQITKNAFHHQIIHIEIFNSFLASALGFFVGVR